MVPNCHQTLPPPPKQLKTHDIYLPTLSTFPSDEMVQSSINTAYKEAHTLWTKLGFVYKAAMKTSVRMLPSVDMFLHTSSHRNVRDVVREDVESEDEGDGGEDDESIEVKDRSPKAPLSQHTPIPMFRRHDECEASSRLEASIMRSSLNDPKSKSVLYASVALDMEMSRRM